MYCRVFACDFDGTGATDGQLSPELAAALSTARAQGLVTLLVTGRVLEELEGLCSDLSIFDALVAENGAIVRLQSTGRTIQLGEPPPQELLGDLRARRVPFHVGVVLVGTWDRHAGVLLEMIRRYGADAQIIFNREAVMLLPSGVNKAVGVRRALEEIGRSERNLIAFGDAENDVPLLRMAQIGVAARGAVPVVAARADDHLSHPGGAGLARYIHEVLENGGVVPTPPRHQIVLGTTVDGTAVVLPGSGVNVMITGDARSGKSWLAGLVAEQLLEQGYRLCILDPEGDFMSLEVRPRVLVLGDRLSLANPTAVAQLLRDEPASLVLHLGHLSQREQTTYVEAVLRELEAASAVTGIPHWILIDEAQYFFHDSKRQSFPRTTNFLFTTYRPSLVSTAVFGAVGAHLIMRTAVEDERYLISSVLRARGPRDLNAAEALAALETPRAGLLLTDPASPQWQVFTPGGRVMPHAHHARKYADTRLPEDKAFRFLYTTDGPPLVAHDVVEFHSAVQTVPLSSLRHHLMAGDFSRWAAEVLSDERLARGLRKLERAAATGAAPDRAEILAHIEDQYVVSNESLRSHGHTGVRHEVRVR
jgi:hydroxymethylpyrimidine pyrophosphatase-like HAD family hydrolase